MITTTFMTHTSRTAKERTTLDVWVVERYTVAIHTLGLDAR